MEFGIYLQLMVNIKKKKKKKKKPSKALLIFYIWNLRSKLQSKIFHMILYFTSQFLHSMFLFPN